MNFTGVAMQNWPVVLASRANNCVLALDAGANTVYKFDASTGAQLDTYAGAAMAMSPRETKLFVFNRNAAAFGVSIVDIRSRAISPPIGFGPVAAMVSNDSDTLLFCASTNNMNTVARVTIDAPGNRLTFVNNITVGTTPISMVFNDDSSMLYVANYKSNNVSLIRISDNSVATVNLDTREPNSMVYQKASKRLFVACEGEDKVAMIELSKNNAVTYIKAGNRPSQLLFNPNQEILYVANFGDNTVTLIDAVGGTAKSTLTVGEGPIGMGLNGDSNLLFVCNYCSRTLSVIDLLGNYVLSDQLPTGKDSGNAFGVSVFLEGNDYAKVFVGKENFPPRPSCKDSSTNTSLSVAAFSIQKPGTQG
jgi:YVTN family beta-propeller protein